jgi:hypothetical protein
MTVIFHVKGLEKQQLKSCFEFALTTYLVCKGQAAQSQIRRLKGVQSKMVQSPHIMQSPLVEIFPLMGLLERQTVVGAMLNV